MHLLSTQILDKREGTARLYYFDAVANYQLLNLDYKSLFQLLRSRECKATVWEQFYIFRLEKRVE